MKTIAILKNNKLTFGNAESLSSLLGVTGQAIRDRIYKGHKVAAYNDYIVFLDVEKIK